nr:hypothetical protein CFP56_24411 [Quercus suber]
MRKSKGPRSRPEIYGWGSQSLYEDDPCSIPHGQHNLGALRDESSLSLNQLGMETEKRFSDDRHACIFGRAIDRQNARRLESREMKARASAQKVGTVGAIAAAHPPPSVLASDAMVEPGEAPGAPPEVRPAMVGTGQGPRNIITFGTPHGPSVQDDPVDEGRPPRQNWLGPMCRAMSVRGVRIRIVRRQALLSTREWCRSSADAERTPQQGPAITVEELHGEA